MCLKGTMNKILVFNDLPYDRRPSASDIRVRQECAAWFRNIDWTFYGTFTFDRPLGSKAQGRSLFKQYLSGVERDKRGPIPVLFVEEDRFSGLGKPGEALHFHALLKTPSNVTAAYLKDRWQQWPYGGNRCQTKSSQPCYCNPRCEDGGSARVCIYDPRISAAFYLFKGMHSDPDSWDFLRPHLLGIKPESWRSSSKLRRSIKRQHARDSPPLTHERTSLEVF